MDCRQIFLLVFGLTTVSGSHERVWLRDVTFDHSTRNLVDGLPPYLNFELHHNGGKVKLNLRENRRLNINAPVYEGSTTGMHLRKYPPITNVRYYQDKQNGGSFHVTCEPGTKPCKRHLTGNLFLNDVNYDVNPSPSKLASRMPAKYRSLGSPYRLVKSQAGGRKGAVDVNNNRTKTKMISDYMIPPEFKKNKNRKTPFDAFNIRDTDYKIPPSSLNEKERKKNEILKKLKELLDVKPKQTRRFKRQQNSPYAVELLIVIDPYLWQQFFTITRAGNGLTQEEATELHFRRMFSHIVNGMSLRYEAIEDPDMDIYLTLSGFLFYKRINDFPPLLPASTKTTTSNGRIFVSDETYLTDLVPWASNLSAYSNSDHIMTFTTTNLYGPTVNDDSVIGLAWVNGTCTRYKVSVNEVHDYYLTVTIASHELGHNLGSDHDGDQGCSADDMNIMAPAVVYLDPRKEYTVNPWRFSKCTVRQFKAYFQSLGDRDCLLDKGDYFNLEEYNEHVSLLPGERYNVTEQCKMLLGPDAKLCEGQSLTSENMCAYGFCCEAPDMSEEYPLAAMGTACGPPADNKWCFEGRCQARTNDQTTKAPTTQRPATKAPTTQRPTTKAPTTQRPTTTTKAPTTARPIPTNAPSTQPPTTFLPTTELDMTSNPSCSDSGFYGYSCADLSQFFSRSTLCFLFEEECCSTCGVCVDKGYYGFACPTVVSWFDDDVCEYEEISSACCETCSTSSFYDYYYYY